MFPRIFEFIQKSQNQQNTLLFDTPSAANEIAFMLGGEWDGCNAVISDKSDELAVNTAASLMQAKWCYVGAEIAYLTRLTDNELLRRYRAGERNFINANLRGARLDSQCLNAINFSWAKLTGASLRGTNLSNAELTAADLTTADLTQACFNKASLNMTNLSEANLAQVDFRGANLYRANLRNVDLTQADFSGANLTLADLRGANLTETKLSGANLSDAKIIAADLAIADIA